MVLGWHWTMYISTMAHSEESVEVVYCLFWYPHRLAEPGLTKSIQVVR